MSKHSRTKIIYNFDDEYRVTAYDEAGVTQIEKLLKRKKNKEWWKTVFHAHTSLLEEITDFAKQEDK